MQLTPEVEIPTISIRTRWPGASPGEVEREIIQEQEEQLQSVEGVTKLSAECSDSDGRIRLEFAVGTDLSEALLKVNSRLQQVPEYPEDADEPVIYTSDSNSRPIAYFILRPWVASSQEVAEFQTAHPALTELLEPARRAQILACVRNASKRFSNNTLRSKSRFWNCCHPRISRSPNCRILPRTI